MEIVATSLDDLLRKVFEALLSAKTRSKGTRGDFAGEKLGALLKLKNPRARLSRTESRGKVFSALGELFWYLSGSNSVDHIKYYVPAYEDEAEADGTIWGAYGPRLKKLDGKHDQLSNICTLLNLNRTSKRAVIQLFAGTDIANPHELKVRRRETPCTCTLQFLVRKDRLHVLTSMRSNDAYLGLPHDVFAFTMLQELVARSIGVELGEYHHFVGSLHLYSKHQPKAERFLAEGWQATVGMPAMPLGDQWQNVDKVIEIECLLRAGKNLKKTAKNLPEYWLDIVRLLQVYQFWKSDHPRSISEMKSKMHSNVFHAYLQPRKKRTQPVDVEPQPTLGIP